MNKRHSLEEKQSAIKRYIKDRESPLKIIKDIEISKSTFYNWLSEYQNEQKQSDHKKLTVRNFKMFESKIARLEGIIKIIKKANVLPNSPLKDKLSVAENLSKKLQRSYALRGVGYSAGNLLQPYSPQ